jgi:hypothetical protein
MWAPGASSASSVVVTALIPEGEQRVLGVVERGELGLGGAQRRVAVAAVLVADDPVSLKSSSSAESRNV